MTVQPTLPMQTANDAPMRCPTCGGSGNGQTVITGNGTHTERCSTCGGAGRL